MKLAGWMTQIFAAWALSASLAFGQAPRASLSFEPAAAQVGEPVVATLRLEHARGEQPKLASLGLDDAWVVFDERPAWTWSEPDRGERETTTWVFEIAALEPGEYTLAEIPLSLGEQKIAVDAPVLTVRGELGEGEDAPRALRGLGEIQVPEDQTASWAWIAAGAIVFIVALLLVAWRFARRRAPAEAPPAPSARLAILEAKPLDTPEEVQAAHFALTRLVREAADLRSGLDRTGLTDEEWRAAVREELDQAGLAEADRGALDELFERASRVKYGSDRPTHWATRESLAQARTFAARLEAPRAVREEAA